MSPSAVAQKTDSQNGRQVSAVSPLISQLKVTRSQSFTQQRGETPIQSTQAVTTIQSKTSLI